MQSKERQIGARNYNNKSLAVLFLLIPILLVWQSKLLLHLTIGGNSGVLFSSDDINSFNNSVPLLDQHLRRVNYRFQGVDYTLPNKKKLRRRAIYQCTCADNSFWANRYWNIDLGRGKQWRRALQRIDELIPDIETREYIQDVNSTFTCEQLIEKDMQQHGEPDAFEVIYSLRYNCTQSKLDLRRINIDEYVETIPWNGSDTNAAHIVRKRGNFRIIYDWGETFQGADEHCNTNKQLKYAKDWIRYNPEDVTLIELSHSKRLMTHQQLVCNTIHVPEQVDWATMLADYYNETVEDMLTKRMSREEAIAEIGRKEVFAGLVVFSTWKSMYGKSSTGDTLFIINKHAQLPNRHSHTTS